MSITDQHLNEFATHGYTFIEQLVPPKDRTRLCQRAMYLSQNPPQSILRDPQAPGTPSIYKNFQMHGDFHMEDLLESLVPEIEQVTQRPLFPTYSYFRVYKAEDVLNRHVDRPACEFSVSLNLGYRAPAPWLLWVEGPLGARGAAMEPGDAVVYRGLECPHWRESFTGEFVAQLFLHYVDQEGPHAEWKFDKRPRRRTIPKRYQHSKDFRLAQGVQNAPLGTLIFQQLQANCAVPDIVNDTMMEFQLSQIEAEAVVTQFILELEKSGLLFVD